MRNRPFRMALWALTVAASIGPALARGQEAEAKKDEPPAPGADARPGPPPIPVVNLLPTLKTTPEKHGATRFNVQFVDASLLPRDKQGIWVLDFGFKSMRLRTIDVPGKGRRIVHYLYYRIVNRTGKPREFVPQFTLVTDTGKRYEEAVNPMAVQLVKHREDGSIPLLGAVDIAGVIPPSLKDGVDDAVYGVALWENVDPNADRMQIFVRGLSDGYQEVASPDGGKPTVKYKTLRIDLIRRGDNRHIDEKEIQLNDPAYEWIYW